MAMAGWDLEGSTGEKVEYTQLAEGTTIIRLLDSAPTVRWVQIGRAHV